MRGALHDLEQLVLARSIQMVGRRKLAGDFQFRQGLIVAIHGHETGRQPEMIFWRWVQPHRFAELFFGGRQVLLLVQGGPQFVMGKSRPWI